MSADPLDLFVDAYRAETVHRDRDARTVRARVIATAGARRRARHSVVWLCAATVLFVGSAALAAGGGQPVVRLLEWLRPEAPEPAQRETRTVRHAAARPPTQQTATPSAPAASADDPSRNALPLSALPVDPPPARTTRRAAAHDADQETSPAATGPDLSAELSLYQRAHALHFGGADPARALDAWRLYLQEHPEGALAAEARLNEAVCLVKLGRRTEGRRILESLAAGNAPQSSQRQAREVLHALGPDSAR